uniref:Uncharacterized protein n=1 Tax=Arundo donax TaxID=35708 RepID=A0A0A9A535_ARUDO
MSSVSASLG